MINIYCHRQLALGVLLIGLIQTARADDFQDKVVPFVKAYCVECHDSKTMEAQLDLTKYTTTGSVAADYRKWEHVVTFVTKEEMPPEKSKQPTAQERAGVLKVLNELMLREAKRSAGDPGVVLPRRLTNAEYNNAIRDLTGADIRPADSFPIDPASGEGFSNTGEALVMSPNLFKKYYAAAQFVADHALLTPTRLSFAPHPVVTFADQKKLTEQAILSFYQQHAVDYTKYLTAAWSFRYRPDSQAVSPEQWAKDAQLSPKYFRALWDALQDDRSKDQYYMSWLRRQWNALPKPQVAGKVSNDEAATIRAFAQNIQRLSKLLCVRETEAIVSNAGNGPVEHIDRRKKTAAARDTFDTAIISDSRRLHVELMTEPDESLLLVIRALPRQDSFTGVKPKNAEAPDDGGPANRTSPLKTIEGYVLLKNLTLSSNGPQSFRPNDNQKNLSLKSAMMADDPNEYARWPWGVHPEGGQAIDPETVALPIRGSTEMRIPAKVLAAHKDRKHLYVDVSLFRDSTKVASAQVSMNTVSGSKFGGIADPGDSLLMLPTSEATRTGSVTLIRPESPLKDSIAASGAEFCKLFPNRFFFADDTRGLSAGFHLIEGFFRDDQPLYKWVLDHDQQRQLDRLWDELYFVTGVAEKMLRGFVFFERSERNFMKHRDFDSIKEEDPELATEASMLRFEQIYLKRSNIKEEPIAKWAATIEAGRADDVPAEIEASPVHHFFTDLRQALKRRATQLPAASTIYQQRLLEFAQAAYRRPLTNPERNQINNFYDDIATSSGIDAAVRQTIVRILVSLNFCYRVDVAPAGRTVQPLSDLALASRLSFFLWSSVPDAELRTLAENGKLNNDATLKTQVRRMLADPRASGFALNFFGQWLNYADFRQTEAVNRTAFPAFDDALKQAMWEEPTRFITHVLKNDLPVTELLRSDTTVANKKLAQHYGLAFNNTNVDSKSDSWQLVSGLHQQGRSGLLGMAVFLTKNSQPQRTSPVKRGFWVVHKLLGKHIPPPPPDVAVLPAKETDTAGKTIRQLLALHTEDNKCARCHQRFDPIGLAMEGFDSIGRARSKDLAGRPIDNSVKLASGEEAKGVAEFSVLLAKQRRREFVQTLSRKLLGYALGRSLQLSDEVLLLQMESNLDANSDRVGTLFETIVLSPVFRTQRCQDFDLKTFEATTPQ